MDRNKICEAMYALPGGVVVKRRKSQLRAAVLFIAGVALVVVNNMYGAELTNNMRSAIVFIGGLLILSGMVMAAIQLFGSGGVPFHKDKHCYLVFEELYFDRGVRADVVQSVEDGAVDRLLGLHVRMSRRSRWPSTVRPTTVLQPCRRSSTPTWSTSR